MKFLCWYNIHIYRHKFTPFADQPFLTDNVEDELCDVEGSNSYECKYCGKVKEWKNRKGEKI
jgi:hypothetical protein